MTRVAMWPVVAASHPLAALPLPLAREALEPHVQLVLTDLHAADPESFRRDRQPSHLAVRRPRHPA